MGPVPPETYRWGEWTLTGDEGPQTSRQGIVCHRGQS